MIRKVLKNKVREIKFFLYSMLYFNMICICNIYEYFNLLGEY